MAVPFGRITSGRGFAPNSFEAYELPAAGYFSRDLDDPSGKTTTEAWFQHSKMLKSLQGMQRHGSSSQIQSVMPGQCHSVAPWHLAHFVGLVPPLPPQRS